MAILPHIHYGTGRFWEDEGAARTQGWFAEIWKHFQLSMLYTLAVVCQCSDMLAVAAGFVIDKPAKKVANCE